MTIEKRFPSLKGKGIRGCVLNGKQTYYFWNDVIEENCLDKERVRKARDKLLVKFRKEFEVEYGLSQDVDNFQKIFDKELDL